MRTRDAEATMRVCSSMHDLFDLLLACILDLRRRYDHSATKETPEPCSARFSKPTTFAPRIPSRSTRNSRGRSATAPRSILIEQAEAAGHDDPMMRHIVVGPRHAARVRPNSPRRSCRAFAISARM